MWPFPPGAECCSRHAGRTQPGCLHVWGVTRWPRALLRRFPAPTPIAFPPLLLGRLVALESFFLIVSVGFSLSSAGFCFDLSVAELLSAQRAYFYQRFPILHLEPGDWPPSGVCVWCIRSCARSASASFPPALGSCCLPIPLVCPWAAGQAPPPCPPQASGRKPDK